MESKELPTIEQYQDLYAKGVGYHNWTEFCAFESKGTIIQEVKKMAHEYAALFAKHHVAEAVEAVKGKAEIEYKYIESLNQELPCVNIDSIENAYPESEIK